MSDMPAPAPIEGDQPLPMEGEGELPDLPEGAVSSEGLGEFEDALPITISEEDAQTLLDDGEVEIVVPLDEDNISVRLVVGDPEDPLPDVEDAGVEALGAPDVTPEEGAVDVGPADGVDAAGAVLG